MKKSLFVLIVLATALAFFGCSSAIKSIDLQLSGKKITPVFLPDSSLLASSESGETYETDPPETIPSGTDLLETESPETLSSETEPLDTLPTEPEPSETLPSVTDPPETLPPATRPPETVPSERQTPASSAPPATPSETAPRATVPPTETTSPHTEDNVERIEILTLPDKTVYDQYHEAISFAGLSILARWSDGYEKVLTEGFTVSDVNGNTAPVTSQEGNYTLYVHFGNQTASFVVSFTLSENAPLRLDSSFASSRQFYEGEYLRHLIKGAWVGEDYIPGSDLTFSHNRLPSGLVTVIISWKQHKAEKTFSSLPREQYELTMEDMEWLRKSEDDILTEGARLSAEWFFERLLPDYPNIVYSRPLPTDVIGEEEFTVDPPILIKYGAQSVTVSCRGLSVTFTICLYY